MLLAVEKPAPENSSRTQNDITHDSSTTRQANPLRLRYYFRLRTLQKVYCGFKTCYPGNICFSGSHAITVSLITPLLTGKQFASFFHFFIIVPHIHHTRSQSIPYSPWRFLPFTFNSVRTRIRNRYPCFSPDFFVLLTALKPYDAPWFSASWSYKEHRNLYLCAAQSESTNSSQKSESIFGVTRIATTESTASNHSCSRRRSKCPKPFRGVSWLVRLFTLEVSPFLLKRAFDFRLEFTMGSYHFLVGGLESPLKFFKLEQLSHFTRLNDQP